MSLKALMCLRASLVAQLVKNPPTMQENTCSAGDLGSIPGSGRFPAEGNGNPLQYSCLENSMDRWTWLATVHRVTKESDTTDWLTLSTLWILWYQVNRRNSSCSIDDQTGSISTYSAANAAGKAQFLSLKARLVGNIGINTIMQQHTSCKKAKLYRICYETLTF